VTRELPTTSPSPLELELSVIREIDAALAGFSPSESLRIIRKTRQLLGLAPPSPPDRQRPPRHPTLASVAKQATKAALDVARYEVKPDGTVVVVTGAGEQQQGNEVDEWIAKHASKTKGH
jgi:hypothetical protein